MRTKKDDERIREILVRIDNLMQDQNVNRNQMARMLKIDPSTVSAWFNNESLPNALFINEIARILHVSIDYLVNGKDTTMPVENMIDDYDELILLLEYKKEELQKFSN